MKQLALLMVLFWGFAVNTYSQDKIYKKGGEVIQAKISEVGTTEIKYNLFNDTQGPLYTIEKNRITKVVYQNGRTEFYENSLRDPELYADQARQAIKINFLSPLRGYTQLNYERSLKPGRAYELGLGIIGLGKRQELDDLASAENLRYRKQRGCFIAEGYKFNRMPDYVSGKDRYNHIIAGCLYQT